MTAIVILLLKNHKDDAKNHVSMVSYNRKRPPISPPWAPPITPESTCRAVDTKSTFIH
jgi:hypothetical protein